MEVAAISAAACAGVNDKDVGSSSSPLPAKIAAIRNPLGHKTSAVL